MTFLANEVHTTLLSYRVSTNYLQSDGPPVWERQGNLLLRPDQAGFEAKVRRVVEPMLEQSSDHAEYFQRLLRQAGEKYSVRTGWMVRTHPLELPGGRILLPLYSDVFDFSLIALSDDAGETWRPSEPIVGWGAVQPSLFPRSDRTLAAFMRDNGPAPKRVMMSLSMDQGESWGPVVDIVLPNPGSSVEAVRLRSGSLLIAYNDAEKGRHRLAVSLSTDDGQTWPRTRYLDQAAYGEGSFHYPSLVEGAGGVLHATYTYGLPDSADGRRRRSIRYARFNQEWIEDAGDPQKQP